MLKSWVRLILFTLLVACGLLFLTEALTTGQRWSLMAAIQEDPNNTSQRDLVLLDSQGNIQYRLTAGNPLPGALVWSQTGRWLLTYPGGSASYAILLPGYTTVPLSARAFFRSPDDDRQHRHFLYYAEDELYRLNLLNRRTTQLTHFQTGKLDRMTIAPDGSGIVIQQDNHLRHLSITGEVLNDLAPGRGGRWSPGSTWIGFRAYVDGDTSDDDENDRRAYLSRIRPDGTQQEIIEGETASVSYWHWSPDSTWLAYQRNPDTLVIRHMAQDITRTIPDTAALFPRWSADSRWLIAVNTDRSILLIEPETDTVRVIGEDLFHDYDRYQATRISPDSRFFAFQTLRNDLAVLDLHTGQIRTFENARTDALIPDFYWTPDSCCLSFAADDDLHLLDVESGTVRNLTARYPGTFYPGPWRP